MQNSPNKAEKYMHDRFGVNLDSINLERINSDYWLTSKEKSELECETRGIRAVRDMDIGLKPTTYALQLLQDNISNNIVEISRKDLRKFNEDQMIQREMEKKGYVALELDGRIIGCGFYMDGLISSRIPEGRLKELVDTF